MPFALQLLAISGVELEDWIFGDEFRVRWKGDGEDGLRHSGVAAGNDFDCGCVGWKN